MRILVIGDSPYPLVSGDRIRAYNLLKRMARQHEVWFATVLEEPADEAGLAHLDFLSGVEYAFHQRHNPLYHLPGLLKFGLSGKPLELKFSYSEELVKKLRALVSRVDFDLVAIFHSHNAIYLEILGADFHGKSILMTENVEFSQFESIYKIERQPLTRARAYLNYRMMKRWEPRFAGKFDHCIAVSDLDAQTLTRANPRLKVDLIPNGVDTRLYHPLPPCEDAQALLFIGKMSYTPCSDAAVYFCREILPLIREKKPGAVLWIVGREPPEEVQQLECGNIHVTGRVEEILPYYQKSAICVVPLRAGGGTRLKILEAMALGRPVVSTSVGCEGLEVTDGVNILVADTPADFAHQVLALLDDPALAQHIAGNARSLVESTYDWEILSGKMLTIFQEVVGCM